MSISANGRKGDEQKLFHKSYTAAANAGNTTIALTHGNVYIEEIVLRMVTHHADMTSIELYGGSGGGTVTFFSTTDGAEANLDNLDDQIAWIGAAVFGDGVYIDADLAGTGANNITFTVSIKYRALTPGSYLS